MNTLWIGAREPMELGSFEHNAWTDKVFNRLREVFPEYPPERLMTISHDAADCEGNWVLDW